MGKHRFGRIATGVACAILALASVAVAQRIFAGGRGGFGVPPKWATAKNFDGSSFNFCRGFYASDRREDGGSGWNTDYPGADNNFSVRLSELTKVRVKMDAATGQPDFVVVRLTDPLLFQCPIVYMEDVGTAHFSEAEVEGLRAYLLKGGFLEVDDYWGTEAQEQWDEEIARVLPPGQFPTIDIPRDHPIMHEMYNLTHIEQVSSIQFWRRSGGDVSERGEDSPYPNYRGIADAKGRLMVVMAHNTDIPDTWEREGESADYFDLFSPEGYGVGINTVVYALTH